MESQVTQSTNGYRQVFTFEVWMRPWTVNAERAGNRWERAKNTKMWREHFASLSPDTTLTDATVDVTLELKGRLQDTAACMPAVKAAIDGMVDANLFPDDTGDHVTTISFHAPSRQKVNKIIIKVEGELYGQGSRTVISSD